MSVPITFVAAMKQFFGYRPGNGAGDFMNELRQLTPEDKKEFHLMLNAEGIVCTAPGAVPGQA